MVFAVLSGFVLAAAAPWLHRRLRAGWSGPALALLPAGLAIYFWAQPAVPRLEGYDWVPSLGLRLSFALDGLSRLFALLITGIGALVLVYASAYMGTHQGLGRLYMYLLVFMGSMLGVVLADNLLALFVFWELTSFSSYLLIGFDQHRAEARGAALQALLVTSAGGLMLLAGVLLLGAAGSTYELSELAARRDAVHAHAAYAPALVLVLAGAFTKSAQVPFHFWLPNAMEAPTPVSAYLHSSTMVKAGVYLLARLSPVLGGTVLWQVGVGGVGLATMVIGAVLAVSQTDLKRVLAYSTISALGMLTMLLGLGGARAITAAVVFLLAHALYKGALFLVAGGIAHATGERDVTRLNGLGRAMPFTAAAGLLAALSMAGVLPFVGFTAKELALDAAWHSPSLGMVLTTAMVVTSALLVVAALIAGIRPFVGRSTPTGVHEGPPGLWLGALLLAAIGLLASVAPQLWVDRFVAPAVASIAGAEIPVSLALWHGWNVPLGAGVFALAAGVLLFTRRDSLRTASLRCAGFSSGPETWYAHGFDGLNRVARAQTRVLQEGTLRHDLFVVVCAAVLIVGVTLSLSAVTFGPAQWSDIRPYEAIVAVAMLVAIGTVVRSRSRLGAVAALGAVGTGMALLFAMFGAPDLAMTQFVIEALLVILFVLVFYDLPPSRTSSPPAARLRDAALALTGGLIMGVLALVATTMQIQPAISGYFVEHSLPAAHGRNVVNVILVDFRAADTLGEISVLAAAGVGVYALLKLRPRGEMSGAPSSCAPPRAAFSPCCCCTPPSCSRPVTTSRGAAS
jgi:multicomponent Na+:H+ antiporter subunit A